MLTVLDDSLRVSSFTGLSLWLSELRKKELAPLNMLVLKVVTNEKGEAVREVVTIIC